MIPVLETPEVRRRAMPVSVETWRRMQEQGLVSKRAELIRGVIVEKMSKSPLHTFIASSLHEKLHSWSGGRHWVRLEQPLTLADSEPEPDISVVDGRLEDYKTQHPGTARLVVEVAIGSPAADRAMLPAYAAAGIGEVWIVLAPQAQIECYTQPAAGSYASKKLYTRTEELPSVALPGFVLALAELFRD